MSDIQLGLAEGKTPFAESGKFLFDGELRKQLMQLKQTEFVWQTSSVTTSRSTELHVQLEQIGRIRERSRIPMGVSYQNPRITCDNGRWFISVAADIEYTDVALTTQSIGID